MNVLDQVVVALWFFPVVLFIVIPLCVGAIWLPISFFSRLALREPEPARQVPTAGR